MKDIFTRLLVKLTGLKAMFSAAIILALILHDFSPANAGVLESLIYAVLGAKAVQYAATLLPHKGDSNDKED